MRCPVCEDEALIISSRESIEIDHCPRCRGVWLDRGELDKIIERAAPSIVGTGRSAEPPPRYEDERPRYEERPRDDDRYGPRRKKRRGSFLEDLFDFD